MNGRIIVGDCLEALRGLEDGSVQCCVTSPPYFGLRDYGTGEWEGGEEGCDHTRAAAHGYDPAATSTLGPKRDGINGGNSAHSDATKRQRFREECGRCGATRVDQQIGLESTPDEYVARLVAVFREVKRVLRDDGTLWLNLGDSYAGSWGAQSRGGPPSASSTLEGNGHRGGGPKINSLSRAQIAAHPKSTRTGSIPEGSPFKPKDLLGIPWMVAFALRADGWYLRSEIIWAKPNPMPESVTDRPTKAHEQVFLLSKSARYFYDTDAIREPQDTLGERHEGRSGYRDGHPSKNGGYVDLTRALHPLGRNKRSVWTVATQPYPEAHFATFPPKLIEPMILAGCPREVCGVCGAPWERVTERAEPPEVEPSALDRYGTGDAGVHRKVGGQYQKWLDANPARTVDWRATCDHDDCSGQGVVLDPFAGSGTTLQVAEANGRCGLGIELNPEYARLIERRLAGVTPSMFDAA